MEARWRRGTTGQGRGRFEQVKPVWRLPVSGVAVLNTSDSVHFNKQCMWHAYKTFGHICVVSDLCDESFASPRNQVQEQEVKLCKE